MFQEYTTGYVTDKIELNERFVVLDNKIIEEIANLHDIISDRFKATEDNMIENLRQMIVKSDEAQVKIIENLKSANQNIQDMRETYRAEFSTQLDEFENESEDGTLPIYKLNQTVYVPERFHYLRAFFDCAMESLNL